MELVGFGGVFGGGWDYLHRAIEQVPRDLAVASRTLHARAWLVRLRHLGNTLPMEAQCTGWHG